MGRWTASGPRAWLALVAILGCLGNSFPASATDSPAKRPRPVRTALVEEAPESRHVVLHGVTRSADRANVGFSVPGRVLSRSVRIGQKVEQGDTLAKLDAAGFSNRLRTARAAVARLQARRDQVRRDRERLESAGSSVPPSEVDRARAEEASVVAALAGARAEADEAYRMRQEAELRASFDGVVSALYVEPGEFVAAGQPVLGLTGAGGIEVEVQAPEAVWASLDVGDPAQVELSGLGRRVGGTLRSIARAAGPSGLLPLVVVLDEDDFAVAGLTAAVGLRVPVSYGVTVPLSAIVDPVGGQPTVFVVRESRTERVPVVTGSLLGDRIVVTGELQPDEAVVVAGQSRLLPGDRVEALP